MVWAGKWDLQAVLGRGQVGMYAKVMERFTSYRCQSKLSQVYAEVWGVMERSLRLDGEKNVYPEGRWGFPSGGERHPLSAACNSV